MENPWTRRRPRPQSRKLTPSSNRLPAGRMTRPLPFQALPLTLASPSFPAWNPSQTTSLPHAPMSALFRTPESPSQQTRTPLSGAAEHSRKWNKHGYSCSKGRKHRILSNFTKAALCDHSALEERKPQISPLRFAPVEMTKGRAVMVQIRCQGQKRPRLISVWMFFLGNVFRPRSHGPVGPPKVMKNGRCSATTLPGSAFSLLCHLDRSAAQWRDLRFSGPFLEMFFDRPKRNGGTCGFPGIDLALRMRIP
jgi:hypothetical protein